jgi:hypothetical protein
VQSFQLARAKALADRLTQGSAAAVLTSEGLSVLK